MSKKRAKTDEKLVNEELVNEELVHEELVHDETTTYYFNEMTARQMMQSYMKSMAAVDALACCNRNCINSISLQSQKNVSNLFEWKKVEATVDDSSASCVVARSDDEKRHLMLQLLSNAFCNSNANDWMNTFDFSAVGIENYVCEKAAQYMLGK